MRYQLLFVLLTICYLSQAQEIELQKLKSSIDSLDLLISRNEQKIEVINDENHELLVKKNLIISRRNEILTSNDIGEVYVCIVETPIYEKSNGTYDIARLGNGDKVKVLETSNNLYKVLFKGVKGYIWKSALISEFDWNMKIEKEKEKRIEKEKEEKIRIANKTQEEKIAIENKKKDQQNAIEKRKLDEREKKFEIEKRKTMLERKYGVDIALRIFEKKIWIGMTKEMLFESWGRPNDINRTVGSWGVHEQCIYTGAYVYIENGVVTSWQD